MFCRLYAWSPVLLLLACGQAPAQAPIVPAPHGEPPPADWVGSLLRAGPVQPFDRPVLISSAVRGETSQARIEALLDRPFAEVQAALDDPWKWCAAMILHINNSACRVEAGAGAPRILLRIARQAEQPAEGADELDFSYQPLAARARGTAVRLSAAEGPLGTSNHTLVFEAAPAGEARTALRLSYAYTQNVLAQWALRLYLSTLGPDKVGFSRAGNDNDAGEPRLVGGVRGLLERNLVLYLIAVEAAVRTPAVSDTRAFRRRLIDYFAATERHPRQLRETSLDGYLALKLPLAPEGMARAPVRSSD